MLGGGALASTVDVSSAKAAAAKALSALDVIVIVTGLVASGLMAMRRSPGDRGDMIVESTSGAKTVEGGDERWKWSLETTTVPLKDGRGKDRVRDRRLIPESAEAGWNDLF